MTDLELNERQMQMLLGDKRVLSFIQKAFKNISYTRAKYIAAELLSGKIKIPVKNTNSRGNNVIFKMNKARIDGDFFKLDFMRDLGERLKTYTTEIHSEITESDEEFLKEHGEDNVYPVNKNVTYKIFEKSVCDESEAKYVYNFKEADIKPHIPSNINTLQRSKLHITTKGIQHEYATACMYRCPVCEDERTKKMYEVRSSKLQYKCEFMRTVTINDETKTKVCNEKLYYDDVNCETRPAFYYEIKYRNESGEYKMGSAISFEEVEPGKYDTAFFAIPSPNKMPRFHIVSFDKLNTNKLDMPERNGENYVLTLTKIFDKYVEEKAGIKIHGLLPIKIALILQTLAHRLRYPLLYNIMIVGDASTGKSMIFKYWLCMLNNYMNLSSNGLSISVPGLRGTKDTITLMNKETKIITPGYLGMYNTIHIDEAGEAPDLVTNLKTFLLEANYSYNKAGATGSMVQKRTCHINISQNLDYTHLGQYRGRIRKAYKDENLKIGDEIKVEWNELWDLHLPLFKYDNVYLRKVIIDVRNELKLSQKFWIDNYDFALHERFPFYFYLVNEKDNPELNKVVTENMNKKEIDEVTQLVNVLRSRDIERMFAKVVEFDNEYHINDDFRTVEKIIKDYDIHCDTRTLKFYCSLVKLSRIINMRKEFTEDDYDLLRYFIENTNCKLDTLNTSEYKIHGPPNKVAEIILTTPDSDFGLGGDFDD